MDLTLETKNDSESFEAYDPNMIYLRVLKHVEGETYDFKNLDKMPSQVVAVNKKKDTVADFESKVA